MRMLSAALGRHARNGTLEYLEQSLLYAFARNVPRYRSVFALPCDFIDLIYIDDTALSQLYVKIRSLYELQKYVLYVLAHVTGFRQ